MILYIAFFMTIDILRNGGFLMLTVIGISLVIFSLVIMVTLLVRLEVKKIKMEREFEAIQKEEQEILQREFLAKDCVLTELRKLPVDGDVNV